MNRLLGYAFLFLALGVPVTGGCSSNMSGVSSPSKTSTRGMLTQEDFVKAKGAKTLQEVVALIGEGQDVTSEQDPKMIKNLAKFNSPPDRIIKVVRWPSKGGGYLEITFADEKVDMSMTAKGLNE